MRTSNPTADGKSIDKPGFSADYRQPVVVGLEVTNTGIGLVCARFDRNPLLDRDDAQDFQIGYELISGGRPVDSVAVAVLEKRLAKWAPHADVVTGHDIGTALKDLCTAAPASPSLRALAQLEEEWPTREDRPPESRPALIDTALDIAGANTDLERICATVPSLHSRNLHCETRSAWMPIARAAAAVLLSARHLGWCRWQVLDLDELITRSGGAWWMGTW
ncbi:hypothetical protein ACWDYH_31415 [Nocardia goodfellowii]